MSKDPKTKIGKILQSIGGVAPSILDAVGDLTGIEALNKISDLIDGEPNLSAEEKIKVQEIIKLEKEAYYKDLESARNMQVAALQQDDLFSKRYVYYLATFWSIAGVALIFFLIFGNIPQENIRFADTILGFMLGTIVGQIITFFFGSSKGSSDKQKVIEQMKGKIR